MDQDERTREEWTVAERRNREEGREGDRRTTESGQCVILRRLRKTRRPPARFASDRDLKIEGRRRVAQGRMPIAPPATLFSIPSSLCLRVARNGNEEEEEEEEEQGHFASWCDLSIEEKVRIGDEREREREANSEIREFFSLGLSLFSLLLHRLTAKRIFSF